MLSLSVVRRGEERRGETRAVHTPFSPYHVLAPCQLQYRQIFVPRCGRSRDEIADCTLIRHYFVVRVERFACCFEAITNSVLRTLILARHFSQASVRECTPNCMGRMAGFRVSSMFGCSRKIMRGIPPLWPNSVGTPDITKVPGCAV